MYVFILTNQAPDFSAPQGAPRSVHETLEGAKATFANGKYMDKWYEYSPGRWTGPDGFGSILKMEVQESVEFHTVQATHYWQADPTGETEGVEYTNPTIVMDTETHTMEGRAVGLSGDTTHYVDVVIHEHDPGHGNWGIDALAVIRLNDAARLRLIEELHAADKR